ncbi:hypothetical protein CC78DRAFT_351520 [Lojkania enalia]|uniref:Uncharacterized protein n=1 Tax=Lojkania enalia TaxID=147567 RepID=A0A9P4KI54_9PLEO|nr:hypothetical protein CC78DRAFT_351520 [Didymosphaeria enalia]
MRAASKPSTSVPVARHPSYRTTPLYPGMASDYARIRPMAQHARKRWRSGNARRVSSLPGAWTRYRSLPPASSTSTFPAMRHLPVMLYGVSAGISAPPRCRILTKPRNTASRSVATDLFSSIERFIARTRQGSGSMSFSSFWWRDLGRRGSWEGVMMLRRLWLWAMRWLRRRRGRCCGGALWWF